MNKAAELSIAFVSSQPTAAALALEQVPPGDAAAFVGEMPVSDAAIVLGRMQTAQAAAVLSDCEPRKAAELLSEMPDHSRSLALRTLPQDIRRSILSSVPTGQAALLRRNLEYDPGTVGAWMDTPKAVFAPDVTVGVCLARIRRLGARVGTLVFVVDGTERLVGVLQIDALLGAAGNEMLSSIMRVDPSDLSPHSAIANVSSHPAWDSALTMPVCGHDRRLIGALDFDAVRQAMNVSHEPVAKLPVNNIVLHMAQVFLVSLSGLLQLAASSPDLSRLKNPEEN